jgi:hypothetical protein
MRIELNGKDITPLCENVKLSGSLEQVARKLEFNLIVSPTDKNIPIVNLNLGNQISLYGNNGKRLFFGFIWKRNKAYQSVKMKVMAYEGSIYLLKSFDAYNFKNISPHKIAQQVIGDAGLSAGYLEKVNSNLSYIVYDKSLYEIIIDAYKRATKDTGKEYKMLMSGADIEIREVGKELAEFNLINSKLSNSVFEESLEGIVNRIKIIDEKGNEISSVDDGTTSQYGVLQRVLQDSDTAQSNAKNLLEPVKRSADIELLNKESLKTGYAVKVKDSYTGIEGKFKIIDDSHEWKNDLHRVKLKLELMEG